ncbi:hypothetical protein BGW80DRAFT_1456613 [Lactifluus volemus]|nr:hypothetical protein BGW80DRAFT_1456613 [Lactifluus volemus]
MERAIYRTTASPAPSPVRVILALDGAGRLGGLLTGGSGSTATDVAYAPPISFVMKTIRTNEKFTEAFPVRKKCVFSLPSPPPSLTDRDVSHLGMTDALFDLTCISVPLTHLESYSSPSCFNLRENAPLDKRPARPASDSRECNDTFGRYVCLPLAPSMFKRALSHVDQ